MAADDDVVHELLELNARLLASIAEADWATYEELCDPSLSAFEPEAVGHLVEGMDFHRFYFELAGGANSANRSANTTISSPHVRLLGDVAVVSYIRLIQTADAAVDGGAPSTTAFAETRVWQWQDGNWRHVHFHRSEG